jgi:hypothetical protein
MREEIEWRVTYTPPGSREIVRTGTEDQVRAIARRVAERDPVVESRMTLVGDWAVDVSD